MKAVQRQGKGREFKLHYEYKSNGLAEFKRAIVAFYVGYVGVDGADAFRFAWEQRLNKLINERPQIVICSQLLLTALHELAVADLKGDTYVINLKYHIKNDKRRSKSAANLLSHVASPIQHIRGSC